MAAVGDAMRAVGVGAIYLVHGTFAGLDALGLLAGLGRIYPPVREALGPHIKRMVDQLAGDHGNWTAAYAELFERSINREDQPTIPVRRFHWSSENHHLGRAEGAVRLIAELAQLDLPQGKRLLLWGHSHAGNVFALVSQLLAGDGGRVEAFFHAAQCNYRWPLWGHVDVPLWRDVADQLAGGANPLAGHPLDLVTFGTPIRYGWDPRGYATLLHFVNHHPVADLPNTQGRYPPSRDDVLQGAGGDLVQLVGIAGTNFPPGWLSWRRWWADRQLHKLLQGENCGADLLARLSHGRRVPDAGETLLVDYGPSTGNLLEHLSGHAVYTEPKWLLMHAEESVKVQEH